MVGLFFIQQYRFLTITQFAKASGLKYATAAEMLLRFERQRLLGHFGNTGIRGYGKTPKVYFLKERGYRMLVEESGIPAELIGDYKTVHVTVKWSPVMYHRMATLDLLIALRALLHPNRFKIRAHNGCGGQWSRENANPATPTRR